MGKQFSLLYLFDGLAELGGGFATKRMFGGCAVYFNDLMSALLMENPNTKEHRGQKFPYDIWNGFLLPTFYEHQQSLQSQWPELVQHPVLKKWLYLPISADGFEITAEALVTAISQADPRIGIPPSKKKKPKKKRAKKKLLLQKPRK